ncbi:MAG: VWA domain-containing protein [Proteobacteria bacterium]|nr:VWA domain-containing protein [Pseudomonadota bacterium]
MLSPPTTDYDALKYFINSINIDPSMKPGTNIEEAINTAMEGFSNRETGKAIILVTDGEQTAGDYKIAVNKAKEKGVKIFTIGIGTEKGEPIPIRDENGNVVDYKKDAKGNVVMSKLDEKILKEISAETGGMYYNASSGNEFNIIVNSLSKLKKGFNREKIRINYGELFQIPLLIAFLMLIFEMLLPQRRERK